MLSQLSGQIRAELVDVIRALRPRYRVACLTNNMPIGHGSAMARTAELAAQIAEVMALLEHIIESWQIDTRKPSRGSTPASARLSGSDVLPRPEQCVFLDDLGINLKLACAMGMTTIKVGDPAQAIADLEATLGHPVR